MTSQLVELQAEHSTAIQHDQDQHAALQHLQQALEEAQLGVAALQERATLAETAYTSEVQRSHDTQMQLKQEVQRLKQEEQADLLQQQALLDALAARDERVSDMCAAWPSSFHVQEMLVGLQVYAKHLTLGHNLG